MQQNNRITEWALDEYVWAESVEGVLLNGWEFDTEVELHADRLASSVCTGQVSIKDLRRGVRFANELDREAVEVYGADLSAGEQQDERIARRLMHHAGRQALTLVKHEVGRIRYKNRQKI